MKANSRRRVLISSVAMLLVAIVALGTATYAWFTTNTQATATGMQVKTVKSSKLVVSSVNEDWDTTIDYGVTDKGLLPASSADGKNWFKAEANSSTDGSAKAGTYAKITNTGSYVIKDQLNVKNEGETAINGVTITISDLPEYARVALVPTSGKGADLADTGTFTACVYDQDGVAYTPLTAAAAPAADAAQITPKNTYSVSVGELAPNTAKYYNLYVWFEGQDVDCTDELMNTVNLTFTVNGTPAA